MYLIARVKQMRLAFAGLEKKAIIYTLSLLEGDFQTKKWPQGKDGIKSFARWYFVRTLQRFCRSPSGFFQVDNIDSKHL